jgi:hypothetical protein
MSNTKRDIVDIDVKNTAKKFGTIEEKASCPVHFLSVDRG